MNKRPTPSAPTESVLDVTQSSYPHWLGELSRLRQEGRTREGLYAGKPLNGYIKVQGIEVHQVDVTKRKAIRRLFMQAPHKSYRGLLRVANEERLGNASGGKMSLSSLHNMLANPFYAGLIRRRDRLVPGRHEVIISIAEFEHSKESCKKNNAKLLFTEPFEMNPPL